MGNIIVSENQTGLGYAKPTTLGDLINTWAINDFDAGLGYNKPANAQIKQLLKKRSCCTRNATMTIALPTIDLDKVPTTIPSATPPTNSAEYYNLIKDKYTALKVKIFDKESDFNDTNCTITNTYNKDQESYLLPINFSLGNITDEGAVSVVSASYPCQALYSTTIINDSTNIEGVCDTIKKDRGKQSNVETVIAYGVYEGDKESANAYADCNCYNSILRNNKKLLSESKSPLEIAKEEMAQIFDNRCNSQGNNAYKKRDVSNKRLCINNVIVESLTILESGVFNLNQNNANCKDESKFSSNDIPTTRPKTTAKPTTTSRPTTTTSRPTTTTARPTTTSKSTTKASPEAPAGAPPAGGAPAGGTPAAGTPAGGTPAAGTPAAGTPAGGTPAAGTPAGGAPDGNVSDITQPMNSSTLITIIVIIVILMIILGGAAFLLIK